VSVNRSVVSVRTFERRHLEEGAPAFSHAFIFSLETVAHQTTTTGVEEKRMQTLNKRLKESKWVVWSATLTIAALMLALCISIVRADPPFGLTIQVTNSTQLRLTITNAVATNAYEIQRRDAFDAFYPWVHETNGGLGQTNFTLEMGIRTMGFFQAVPCLDCDLDGIENWRDANPYDVNVGILTITIDSPANGSTFN
jgi:hypothetical protein